MDQAQDAAAAPDDHKERVRKLAVYLLGGGTLGELRGLTAADYEAVYAHAHAAYQQGRYAQAVPLLQLLVRWQPMERRFISALAASLQMVGQYEEAMAYHSLASAMDLGDPVPTFHTAECLLARGLRQQALEMLVMALDDCVPGRHDALRRKAEGLRDLITRQPGAIHEGENA